MVLVGFGWVYLSLEFLPNFWLKLVGLSVGLAIAAIGGFSGRSTALGLPPPFANDPLGWRKAKATYEVSPESSESESENK